MNASILGTQKNKRAIVFEESCEIGTKEISSIYALSSAYRSEKCDGLFIIDLGLF